MLPINSWHCTNITWSITCDLWCLTASLWNARKSHRASIKCKKPMVLSGSAPYSTGGAYSAPQTTSWCGGDWLFFPKNPTSALSFSGIAFPPNFQTPSYVKSYIRGPGVDYSCVHRCYTKYNEILRVFCVFQMVKQLTSKSFIAILDGWPQML